MGKNISEEVIDELIGILKHMELELNQEKTRVVNAEEEPFDFLGFTFRFDDCLYRKGNKYWNIFPSKKSQKRLRRNLGDYLKSSGHMIPIAIASDLNSKIRGWMNYYSIKGISYPNKAKRDIEWYLKGRINRYYKRKSQRKSRLYRKGAYEILVNKYGLIKPTAY